MRRSPRGRRVRRGWRLAFGLFVLALIVSATAAPRTSSLRFRTDDWVTECGASGCSITGLFQQTNLNGRRGSFALVILLGSRQLAVVGEPYPIRARVQIDKNNPAECTGPRYCIFPSREARRAISELGAGSLVLVDVYTGKDLFRSSLSTRGYQASLAELQAAGYAVPAI
ncbi:MAG TPA: hypothetical protein VJ770_30540 [Stellaceae bacterium]|nr:hypothetical protein [Stellaceae bacterium]